MYHAHVAYKLGYLGSGLMVVYEPSMVPDAHSLAWIPDTAVLQALPSPRSVSFTSGINNPPPCGPVQRFLQKGSYARSLEH